MANTILAIRGLSKSYPSPSGFLPVLEEINLSVSLGEFVSIVGPSGCGKTTLFCLISGIEQQDGGSIQLNSKEFTSRRGHFGYMFQHDLLVEWRNVLDNISLSFQLKGLSQKESREKSCHLLSEFKLDNFASYWPKQLSGGMRQRIALLRTLAFNSSFLLLDEPFGFLDALTRSALQQYLLTIWKKKKLTILFITHDIREAILLSDRIYVLTKRPASILREIEVPLKRPRTLLSLTVPKVVHLEESLSALLMKDKHELENVVRTNMELP